MSDEELIKSIRKGREEARKGKKILNFFKNWIFHELQDKATLEFEKVFKSLTRKDKPFG